MNPYLYKPRYDRHVEGRRDRLALYRKSNLVQDHYCPHTDN